MWNTDNKMHDQLPSLSNLTWCNRHNQVLTERNPDTGKWHCLSCLRNNTHGENSPVFGASTIPSGTAGGRQYNGRSIFASDGLLFFGGNSSSSDATDTGSESATSYLRYSSMSATPRTSPSSTPTLPARHMPTPIRARRAAQIRRNTRPPPANPRVHQPSAERKKEKERTNRGGFQEVVHTDQDFLVCYGNGTLVGGNAQTSGNATSSGLMYTKKECKLNSHAVLIGFVDEVYKGAIANDKLGEFEAKAQEYVRRSQEHGDPTYGTLLYNGDEKCRHEGKSKTCLVHGHPNWWECRALRAKAHFGENREKFMASLGLSSGGKRGGHARKR